MIEYARHVPLRSDPRSESNVSAAINDIVMDGLEHFDCERFRPAHPLDERVADGHTSLYFGATGMIWAIDYLGRMGATKKRFDFGRFFRGLWTPIEQSSQGIRIAPHTVRCWSAISEQH